MFAGTKKEAIELLSKVRKDLQDYGLLISEDKCAWGARRRIRSIGFVWDTVEFKLFVPRDKVERTKEKVEELLKKAGGISQSRR